MWINKQLENVINPVAKEDVRKLRVFYWRPPLPVTLRSLAVDNFIECGPKHDRFHSRFWTISHKNGKIGKQLFFMGTDIGPKHH